ncbi:nitric-oxide reductase large subunit [Labilibaculum antarcticum]|uniref:Nitric-oxide reductase large subunit n=1 Tax=Labilibaculum antarcticum TaxID=1717717 RepID=A0A1Y1CL64_9BACT|nr:nitric-oxide reductase large subunit [Labilibaculum antarcticum]BAX81148.1 nitric-oxide reductase large subunit [Labilibaculum antarcticum]
MGKMRRLWIYFILVVTISFAILGYLGVEIYREAPPIPEKVVDADGNTIFTKEDIQDGQRIWLSTGGQELGSIWGHGAYVAPDWNADWIHREAVFILDTWSNRDYESNFENLNNEQQAVLKSRLQDEIRENTYDETSGAITISAVRLQAIQDNIAHYSSLFSDDPDFTTLREQYAMKKNTLTGKEKLYQLNAFFFWTSWACVTERPEADITYTNNWPPEKLIGNTPAGTLILWTGFSILMLLMGIGVLAFYHAKNREEEIDEAHLPAVDPLMGLSSTPSMKATLKYFWIVSLLILAQVVLGVITAHYGVEGQAFFGIPLSEILPYTVTRTWHVQIALFWIATSWLATGLYIAPAVSGVEPKYQKLGVNFLFYSLLAIVVGSLIGELLGIMQMLDLTTNFWFGHQGLEYVDLGRFWQIYLFVGLLLWLLLMVRALRPALKRNLKDKNLLILFVISSVAIALLYGAGLTWGQHTHLSIIEYFRWWVVHLWVEGFFEVFATVVIAFLFVRMKILNIQTATFACVASATIFLTGGILGTFHHLYFTGTPTSVLAIGATFSALEVVPLIFMGYEAFHNYRVMQATEWTINYKWPIYFFISVSFWNLLGAGVFGFMINPPIALYYMQGLNTTAVHAHTALFGVYGMLGIGLLLFVVKGLSRAGQWQEGIIKFSFWSLNIGLMLMSVVSLLPVGLAQTIASVDTGMWFARSPEFMQQDYLIVFKWLRSIGDTIFAIGSITLTYFVFGLKFGWSYKK